MLFVFVSNLSLNPQQNASLNWNHCGLGLNFFGHFTSLSISTPPCLLLRGLVYLPNTVYTASLKGHWPRAQSKMDTFLTGVCVIYDQSWGEWLIRASNVAHPAGDELCHSVWWTMKEMTMQSSAKTDYTGLELQ